MKIELPSSDNINDSMIDDAIVDVQDIAGEIAVTGCRPLQFPITTHPYTREELQQRLPLTMTMTMHHNHSSLNEIFNDGYNDNTNDDTNSITVLIHQICNRQTAQVDVGFGESVCFGVHCKCCR